ncbi:MAG TPA: peptidylprolyl isomerase [Bacteroidota bacterium]|nr:peptidylprolyl isomerase [Bacteroidota bacterium]
MKPFMLLLLLLCPLWLYAQTDAEKKTKAELLAKLEYIMQLQDRRTIHDGKLIEFLGDKDPLVRERAVRAYGSIQDTSVMSLLVERLANETPAIELSAAFAIGQTAGLLSKPSREILEHDLIWVRADKSAATDRLIEEIGKFGTETGLRDLVTRFGDASAAPRSGALIMSIARFGIRGVTAHEATEYIIKQIKPQDRARWEAVYALMRIGDKAEVRAEIDDIAQLYRNENPLARMNVATLLGKVKIEKSSIEPLLKLAEFDSDWRVRVNALKALANFKLDDQEEVLKMFRRSFGAGNRYIALTALTSIGNSGIQLNDSTPARREVLAALKHLSLNENEGAIWQIQAEAATALAKLLGPAAFRHIRIADYPQRLLKAQLLVALGTTGAPEAAPVLSGYLQDHDPTLMRSALEGLQDLSTKNPGNTSVVSTTYNAALHALDESDVAVVITAASILGDSLFARPGSVEPLLAKLSTLRLPDDIEAMQEIAATLGKIKDVRAVGGLQQLVRSSDYSVALAAAAALKAITGNEYKTQMLNSYEPSYTDFDFKYLEALPPIIHVKIETIHGDIMCDFYKDDAPFTIMSMLKLASQRGFYRGLPFHRVVPNFVIQGGDPRGDGSGGPGYSLRSEFSERRYEAGTIGIASAGKDTEGSQFFITQSPQPHLDGRYTIIGKVTSGMNVVDKILVDDHIYDIKVID